MLGLAKRTKARILLASTSRGVRRSRACTRRPEDYWGNVNPIGPRSCYDEGKRCAETLFFDYHRQHDVRIKVARIFNTYGPRMHPDDGRVVSNFIVQALQGEPITIYGDGKQTRSFCYVDDLVDGLIRLMDTPARRHRARSTSAIPGEFTMLELAETVHRDDRLDGRSWSTAPLPQDDPQRRQPDITLASAALGWSPRTQLGSGTGQDDRLLRSHGEAPNVVRATPKLISDPWETPG